MDIPMAQALYPEVGVIGTPPPTLLGSQGLQGSQMKSAVQRFIKMQITDQFPCYCSSLLLILFGAVSMDPNYGRVL